MNLYLLMTLTNSLKQLDDKNKNKRKLDKPVNNIKKDKGHSFHLAQSTIEPFKQLNHFY